ncbi:guanine nucleotide exchange protein smcr8a-like [Salvelinus fontinalis]|uniref:guanine nucleotide exchange protein smcr8a-like n=1 Tax=Salvelinus fontinalis TaxID=8038 RepID=UPI0024855DF8|nr:guanine nucleotide exchange protein smcr8a-like [Salvelinus fontinalis]
MSKLTPAGSREKMIGAPDVVAFTKEDDFGEVGYPDPWVVPEEFSVPLFPSNNNANPWAKTSYAKFTKDFILISEFSEQVGPQPLLTIPDDPKVFGTFDLNYFSLRIMSVDYQASFVGHPTGSGYPRLSFVEDSRVVLGDSKEGAFAYVHHLTLYDLEARGFVRPFCMAYVSADERKIMQQFQELSLLFSRASECLKTGNRRAFARELQRKLRDLEYTRSVLQKEEGLQREVGPQGCYSAHAVDKANELAAMEKSIYEHRDLLRQITSYPLRPRRDPHAAHCQHCVTESQRHRDAPPGPDTGEEAGERRQSYTPQLIKGKSAKCFAKRLKDLTELCEERFYEATVELLTHTERCFRGDLCYLYTRRLDRALRRKQNITNFLFEEELGEEEEEVAVLGRIFCSLNHTVGTDPHSHIHTPSIVLCPAPPESVEVLEVYPPCPDNSTQQSEALTGEERLESSLSDLTMETQDQESSEGNKDSFSSDRSGGEEEEGGDQTPVFLLDAEEGEGETHRVCEREGETEGVFNGKREGETEGVFNGKREGKTEGVFNGKREGETEGVFNGKREGETEGVFNGNREGETEGVFNGKREGKTEGVFNGKREGETEGVFNGKREGETEGVFNGNREGETEGVFNGKREGKTEGVFNGKREGETEGVFNGKREGETERVFERGAEREEGGAETGEGDGQRVPDPELLVQMDTACCMSQEGFLYNSSPPDTLPAAGLQPGSLPLVVNQEPQALLPVQGVYGLGSTRCQSPGAGLDLPISSLGDTTSRGSDQDGSDCTMSASTGSDRAGSPLGYGGVVTLRQKKRAGQGALR